MGRIITTDETTTIIQLMVEKNGGTTLTFTVDEFRKYADRDARRRGIDFMTVREATAALDALVEIRYLTEREVTKAWDSGEWVTSAKYTRKVTNEFAA